MVNWLFRPTFTASCSAAFVQFGATAAATDDAGALLDAGARDAELLAVLFAEEGTAVDAAVAEENAVAEDAAG